MSIMNLALLLVTNFLILTLPIFSAFFTHAYMDPAYFVKFSSLLTVSAPPGFNCLLQVFSICGPWNNFLQVTARYILLKLSMFQS